MLKINIQEQRAWGAPRALCGWVCIRSDISSLLTVAWRDLHIVSDLTLVSYNCWWIQKCSPENIWLFYYYFKINKLRLYQQSTLGILFFFYPACGPTKLSEFREYVGRNYLANVQTKLWQRWLAKNPQKAKEQVFINSPPHFFSKDLLRFFFL